MQERNKPQGNTRYFHEQLGEAVNQKDTIERDTISNIV